MLIFTDANGFYSDLVAFLASTIGIGQMIRIESGQMVRPFALNDDIWLDGRTNGIRVQLKFRPHDLMKSLLRSESPGKIEFEEVGYKVKPTELKSRIKLGTNLGIMNALIQPCFLNYFEGLKPKIEQECGSDPYQWPSVWNFGRVIRNTFGHDGEIHFKRSSAGNVTWKHYAYSPADNGRVILFNDLGVVELIYLMADMDAAAPVNLA